MPSRIADIDGGPEHMAKLSTESPSGLGGAGLKVVLVVLLERVCDCVQLAWVHVPS